MNVLTIDVEEWFQVGSFLNHIDKQSWNDIDSRADYGTEFVLDLLDGTDIKATFFVVGWVAERHPHLVKQILQQGHTVGLHSYMHQPVTSQTPKEFQEDTKKGVSVLSDCTGQQVKYYRAPSYTITKDTNWALEILRAHGIELDSSVFPINHHPDYGVGQAPVVPFKYENGMFEFPISTFRLGKNNYPLGSGAYFRVFPYWLTSELIKRENRVKPLVLNFHPWEFDPDHIQYLDSKIPKSARLSRTRHTFGLSRNRKKFKYLVRNIPFISFEECKTKLQFDTYNIDFQKVNLLHY